MKYADRCEYEGCGPSEISYCHASCCSGEAALCKEYMRLHNAQMFLDAEGYGRGFFGKHHGDVLALVAGAMGKRKWWLGKEYK